MDEDFFSAVREAQRSWSALAISRRLGVIRRARQSIADGAKQFVDAVDLPGRRNRGETLPLEIVPLLDAMRFLERSAARVLASRRPGLAGRPLWLAGVCAEVRREALGIVAVLAPFNYPLLLPGVQVLQALAAGNAVVVKPSPGHAASMVLLQNHLLEAGLPGLLFTVAGETVDDARQLISLRPDKIILTGSAQTGRAVLEQASRLLIPAVMELSGNDAVIVLPGVDLDHAAKSLAWGLCLNGGATCIAPRRVFVPRDLLPALRDRLAVHLAGRGSYFVGPAAETARDLLAAARDSGREVIGGGLSPDRREMQPAIIVDPERDSPLLTDDIFAPILSLVGVADTDEALARIADCGYRLGTSVFGPRRQAEAVARRIDTGFVTVNDLIVSTADPRLPFGGHGASGFGSTRGVEGLLEMTRPKSTIVRRTRSTLHFRPVGATEAELFLALASIMHGRPRLRTFSSKVARLARALVKSRR